MSHAWTFSRAVAVGIALLVALNVVVGALAILSLQKVVASKDLVIGRDERLVVLSSQMQVSLSDKRSYSRAYLMSGDKVYVGRMDDARRRYLADLQATQKLVHTDEGRRLIEDIRVTEVQVQTALDAVIAMYQAGRPQPDVSAAYEATVSPVRDKLTDLVTAFIAREQDLADADRSASSDGASRAIRQVIYLVLGATALASALGVVLTRILRRRIGRTVAEVQSSSTELRATAGQQASTAKLQASSMTEISTTITELQTASRQIAASAQQVVQIAELTAAAGQSGEGIVIAAQASMADIGSQVQVIVHHMVELGEKSQRIGVVLDIVTELAEQTNILAINSTIEAAGAGESGRRFAVVADEIRKLADRMAASTKEIRGLIEVVHAAVSTTVMATETGAKAVDGGARKFSEVASSFEAISALVADTREAAREIELSTRQQAVAVEQVTVAVTQAAQATVESEASAAQTSLTAGQLSDLSKDLLRLVQAEATI